MGAKSGRNPVVFGSVKSGSKIKESGVLVFSLVDAVLNTDRGRSGPDGSVQEKHVFARFSGFLRQLVSWFSCFLFIWGWGGAAVFSRKRPKNEVFRPDFGPHLGGGHAHPSQALV